MNKYQEALNKVYELISDLDFGSQLKCAEQLKTLQELVDKETPKKVIKEDNIYGLEGIIFICPKCGLHLVLTQNYCDRCSQKLDWSDELDWSDTND